MQISHTPEDPLSLRHKASFVAVFLILCASVGYLFHTFMPADADRDWAEFLQEEGYDPSFLQTIEGNTLLFSLQHVSEARVAERIPVIVTAYSSTPWETWGDPFVTASGSRVEHGIVANNLLPFGTHIRLPELYGEEIFTVTDRMHKRKGPFHIDIWMSSNKEAVRFGVKRTHIELLTY